MSDVTEAAERLTKFRTRQMPNDDWLQYKCRQLTRDNELVVEAHLAELDPSPITPDALREMGFCHLQDADFSDYWQRAEMLIELRGSRAIIQDKNHLAADTIGQLRTLLRLADSAGSTQASIQQVATE